MPNCTRRELLGTAATTVGGWILLSGESGAAQTPAGQSTELPAGPYQLPPLPYDYGDLEPYIDAETMKLHHDKHHAAYVKGANAAFAELERIRQVGAEEVARIRAVTEELSFHTCGHILHSLLWQCMKKGGGGDPPAGSELHTLITRDFGNLIAFKAQFSAAAQQVHGSGWAVLVFEPLARRLLIVQAEKHQNLAVWGGMPLLVLDVWEHAYYLRYQNRRSDYIKAFWEVVNWEHVQQRCQQALLLAG